MKSIIGSAPQEQQKERLGTYYIKTRNLQQTPSNKGKK